MTYPTLPFALVTYLANIAKERAALRDGPRHVTVIAFEDRTARSRRFEVETDDNWTAVVEGVVSLATEGPLDGMAILYPTQGPDRVDLGIIARRDAPEMVVQWVWAPEFKLYLVDSGPAVDQLRNGVGVDAMRRLVSRAATPSGRPAPMASGTDARSDDRDPSAPSVSPAYR